MKLQTENSRKINKQRASSLQRSQKKNDKLLARLVKQKKREDINYPYQECNRILLLTF